MRWRPSIAVALSVSSSVSAYASSSSSVSSSYQRWKFAKTRPSSSGACWEESIERYMNQGPLPAAKIGRASCRERAKSSGGGEAVINERTDNDVGERIGE